MCIRDSYQEADDVLAQVDKPALVLPWKGYLDLDFADSTYVANPAQTYFSSQTRSSEITGNGLLDGPKDQFEESILDPYDADWVQNVTTAGFDHVLILKTDSWANHKELLENHTVLYDSPEIAVVEL